MLIFAPLALAILAVYATVRADLLFVGWLAVAPFIQESARETQIGWALTNVFYVLPIGVLLIRMLPSNTLARHLRWYDVLPAGYVCFILLSQAMVDSTQLSQPSFYTDILHAGILVGPPLYYICAFGPLQRLSPTHFAGALLSSCSAIAALGIYEHYTHWNLWGQDLVDDPPRIIVTLSSPGILGAFYGAGIVTAVAILCWNGPQVLRRLSIVTLVLSVPAIFFTYTRAGVIATVVVTAILVATRPRARVIGAALAVLAAFVLFIGWGDISRSSLYQQRASDVANVQGRSVIAKASLELATERPLVGWGYGQFDEAKRNVDIDTGSVSQASLYRYTSHNTYLTILVELGVIGFVLAFLTWLIVVWSTIRRLPTMPYPPWFTHSLLAMIGVVALTALTTDMRFFSFVPGLAWVAVGLLRRGMWSQSAAA